MAKRTHVPKLLHLAEQMCKALPLAGALWRYLYPDNAALWAAYAAAVAACDALQDALIPLLEEGD